MIIHIHYKGYKGVTSVIRNTDMGHRFYSFLKKFLVDREGNVVKRYASLTEPKAIAADIEKLL